MIIYIGVDRGFLRKKFFEMNTPGLHYRDKRSYLLNIHIKMKVKKFDLNI